MSFFAPQNPGIGGLDELTNAEELFLTTFASLTTYENSTLRFSDGILLWVEQPIILIGTSTPLSPNIGDLWVDTN